MYLFEQHYHSKKAFLLVVIIAFVMGVAFGHDGQDGWFSLVMVIIFLLYCGPGALTWNYSALRYTLRHSFDLHFILFNGGGGGIIICVFATVNSMSVLRCIIVGAYLIFGLCVFLLIFNLEAVPLSHRSKQIIVLLIVLSMCNDTRKNLYNDDEYEMYDGVELDIQSLDVNVSLRDMLLMSQFNGLVFWIKKLILMTKYPNCILVATYPRVIWMNSGMRQQTLSSIGQRRAFRATTISLDIYKQSVSQRTDIFLFEDNSIAHRFFKPETAEKVRQIHFSKCSVVGLNLFAVASLIAILLNISVLSIISEICCIVILLIGPFTFDTKMMKFYLKSFDFWYKWFNWTMYFWAYSIWTNHQFDMSSSAWMEFSFRNLAITIAMLHIFSLDAYHVPDRKKKSALLVCILIVIYFHICIVWRLYFMNPTERWMDWEIDIPLMRIKVSLRGMMMNSMGNLIIFMIKQLLLMIQHPQVAAFDLYPTVAWDAEDEEDHQEPILEQT